MIHSPRQARKLLLTLICIELLLVVVYATDVWVAGASGELDGLVDLDGEGNLPAWFSSFQLALVAISFWVLTARRRASERPSRRFLRTCGGFFLLLSIDETAMLHERLTHLLGSRYIDWVPAYVFKHVGNAIICVLVLVACAAAACPHLAGLWRLSRRASLAGATGCVIYLTGAAVLESIGYKMVSSGSPIWLYRAEVAAEEFLEMLGVSVILYGVLLFCCLARNRLRPASSNASRTVVVTSHAAGFWS